MRLYTDIDPFCCEILRARLAKAVQRFRKTRLVISYYEHPSLRQWYDGWTFVPCPVSKALVNQGARDGSVDVKAPEVLILNGPSLGASA